VLCPGFFETDVSFRGNYSFLNLYIQRSQYIRPKDTVHKGAESIRGRKVFKGGNYMRKYGMLKAFIVGKFGTKQSRVGKSRVGNNGDEDWG
jgi:hypothetical protein